ncbi:MAG: Gfo/Idh/MocA family oxidoreductase [bacterium]|jgi:predicted dehydrogenase
MSDKKIKIGFVGVGGMGQCAHLKNYAALSELCEVVALAELRPEIARKVAQRYFIPKTYPSHEEMLKSEKLDGIVASQPFTRHGTLIPDLLKSKIPVFTEKPIAGTIEMGEKIVKAVANSGTFHMVGYHKRSDPATMAAKVEIERLKQTGELGKMKYVRLLMPAGDWVAGGFYDLISSHDPAPQMQWDPADASLSKADYDTYISFVNYYIHQVNLMRHMLGESYEVTHVDPTAVLLVGKSKSGIPCTIEMTPYQSSIDWQESALVCFEKGWVKVELPAPLTLNRAGRVTFFRDPGNGVQPQFIEPQMPWVHAMRQQAVNFIRAIKGEIKPMCEASEALEDMRVARQFLTHYKGV